MYLELASWQSGMLTAEMMLQPQLVYKITSCMVSRHPFQPLRNSLISQSFNMRTFRSLRNVVLAVIPEERALDPGNAQVRALYPTVRYSADILQQSTLQHPVGMSMPKVPQGNFYGLDL